MKHFILLISLYIFLTAGANAQMVANTLSLRDAGFRENKGQVRDQDYKPNMEVKYIYSDNAFNLQLRENGFSYQLTQIENSSVMSESGESNFTEEEDQFDFQKPILHIHRVDVELENANPSPEILTGEASESFFNYYINLKEDKPVLGVKGYKRIMYKDIYPRIDLVFYAPEEQSGEPLKYEWTIHPGGDAARIRMIYHGAEGLVVDDASGDLAVMAVKGVVSESAPVCYLAENGEAVAAGYSLKNNSLRYAIAPYDNSKTMVIDPTLIWGTYYGGEGEETIFESEISLDKYQKVYMTGSTESENDIATSGAFDHDYEKLTDIFLAKFKPLGTLEWGTYFGGKGKDGTFGVEVDPLTNNPVICGSSSTDSGMATPGAYKDTCSGSAGDALISKFSATGNLLWSTYYGGADREHFRNTSINAKGNIFWTGFTASTTMIATAGAYQTVYGGKGDCILGEFNKNGGLVWASYFSGNKEDRGHVITLDNSTANVYVGGTCESKSNFIKNSPYQKTLGNITDAFMAKWDTAGHYLWGTYIGGDHDDRCRGIVFDKSGNLYVTGFTDSNDSIASPGAHQDHWTEGYTGDNLRADDGFLMKFDADGHYKWGTYYGGSQHELVRGLDIDSKANLYIVGETSSLDSIATPDGFQPAKIGNITSSDGMVAKFDSSGKFLWGSYLGSTGMDEGNDVVVDPDDFIYVSVETRGDLNAITPGVHQLVNNGPADVCLLKFQPDNACYDQYEPNEIYTAAKKINGWHTGDINIYGLSGKISSGTDQDWYLIQTTTAEPNYKLVMDKLTQPYNLILLNKQGQTITQTIDVGTSPRTIVVNNLANGKYYLGVVHNATQFDASSCYRLNIYKAATPFVLKEGEMQASIPVQDLILYPNPAKDQLTVNIAATAATAGDAELIIYNVLNQVVYSNKISLAEGYQQLTLPVSFLSKGTYEVVIQNTKKFWMGRLVKG